MTCPGLNHEYQPGRTFYTLQSDSGCYLSHPDNYRNGTGEQEIHYISHEMKKTQTTTHCALTKDWRCAWVVYSLEDLRRVYQYISGRFALEPEKDHPKHPCIGECIRGKYGMITVKGLRKMSPVEIVKSRAVAKKAHTAATSTQTAAQLKMPLVTSYAGSQQVRSFQLVTTSLPKLPTLPDASEKKKNTDSTLPSNTEKKSHQEAVTTSQDGKKKEDATLLLSKGGGLFGYTLPNIP